ncbi:MAG: type II toxin-antitoxin system RelE/ParE family toxin [Bryobacterales bacterium]|nr:type II toxin-antitoxin system RelE/ParE family toxin [Bryobacterales bacterium]
MDRIVAYEGQRLTIAYARDENGCAPGAEFFDGLSVSDQAKLHALFVLLADKQATSNREKFGDLGDGLYEFKSFQIRMPFAYARQERGVVLITHGFHKKKNKTPQAEIERARRILREDSAWGIGKARGARKVGEVADAIPA